MDEIQINPENFILESPVFVVQGDILIIENKEFLVTEISITEILEFNSKITVKLVEINKSEKD